MSARTKLTRTIALAILPLLATACASTAPLTPESGRTLSGSALAGRHGETPDFVAFTPGKAGFGLIGASLMRSKGNEVVSENGVVDPAPRLLDALLGDLAARYGARPVEQDRPARFELEVETTGWQYNYYLSSTSPLPYRVLYSAKATLTDLDDGTVIAEGSCDARPGDEASAPGLDELLANGASRLKSELSRAGDLCLEELRSSVFGLGTGVT